MRLVNKTVRMNNMHPRMTWAVFAIDESLRGWLGYEPHIYSANDKEHSRNSPHYRGMAVDVRTWTTIDSGVQIGTDLRARIVEVLQSILGSDFDVIGEVDHIHIEYDPKHPT